MAVPWPVRILARVNSLYHDHYHQLKFTQDQKCPISQTEDAILEFTNSVHRGLTMLN